MPRLNLSAQIPAEYDRSAFVSIIEAICTQVNNVSEGKLQGRYYNSTVAPSATAMPGAKGDIVWNSNPTVIGSVSPGLAASYLLIGWQCHVSGTPGTWKEMRVLIGT